MSSKRQASDSTHGRVDHRSSNVKRRQIEPPHYPLFESRLDIGSGQFFTPQATFGTGEDIFTGLDAEASHPYSRLSQVPLLSPDENWLDANQFAEFFEPFVESGDDQEQASAEAKPGVGCGAAPKERTLSTESMDEVALDELMGEMTGMENAEPPTSVPRALHRSSRSTEDFDPNLQHSPVSASSPGKHLTTDEQGLEYEVDWNPVHQFSHQTAKDPSRDGSSATHRSQIQNSPLQSTSLATLRSSNTESANHGLGDLMLKPSQTFFHVGEMLEAKASMFHNSPDFVFQLFARVLCSRRENFGHKQYFQFRDLFKESPPFLNGVLMG